MIKINTKFMVDVVIGTRPEAIKMASVIQALRQNDNLNIRVISTGQHKQMLTPILEFFKIQPDVDLSLMSHGQTLNDITIKLMTELKSYYEKTQQPDLILVQGDTTTAMATALYAFNSKIKMGHVEAGLRTGDILSPYPEEFNRRVVSFATSLHFAPTKEASENLIKEGVSSSSIFLTGNSVIDSLLAVSRVLESDKTISAELDKHFNFLNSAKKMILVTTHRRESFGGPMQNILKAFLQLSERSDVQIVFPVHMNPNVRTAVEEVLGKKAVWSENASATTSIVLCPPADYIPFIYLMKKSHFIISDSGGVQEEAPSLGKPVLVTRESTERADGINAGCAILVGTNTGTILNEALALLDNPLRYEQMGKVKNPYGDGEAASRIAKVIEGFVNGIKS
jgi:UDP-N-acetylglucosamine 2-epimerase (non-hydrolysing)